LLEEPTFLSGKATVNYISRNQQLLIPARRRDRGTKLLRYLAEVIVNGNPDVKFKDPQRKLAHPHIPHLDHDGPMPSGTRDRLKELGRDQFVNWLRDEQ